MKKTFKLLIVMVLALTLLTGCDFTSDGTSGISRVSGYSDYEIEQRLNEVKYHTSQLFNNVFYELQRYAEEDAYTASQVIDMTEIQERMEYYVNQLQNDEEFMNSLDSSYSSVVNAYAMVLDRAMRIEEEVKNNPPQPHIHMEYLEDIDIFNTYRSRLASLIDTIVNN